LERYRTRTLFCKKIAKTLDDCLLESHWKSDDDGSAATGGILELQATDTGGRTMSNRCWSHRRRRQIQEEIPEPRTTDTGE